MTRDDADARRDALDTTRSFIVQAPAGSGKTELLIQRYLKLLAIVDEPEEVLAITFTRKAAAEMQLRVLEALRLARAGDEPSEPHHRLTRQLARGALERADAREWRIVESPRRMRILTLDALNASIARMQPVSAIGSGARVVADAALKTAYRDAAVATLDWLTETGPMQSATREVLGHVDNSTGLYVAYLARMLGTRDQWLPIVGSGSLTESEAGALRQAFEDNLRHSVDGHLIRTREALDIEAYRALPSLWRQDGAGLPEAGIAHLQDWRSIADLLLLSNKPQIRKQVNKNQGFPPEEAERKTAMHELLASMADDDSLAEFLHGVRSLPPVEYTDAQWSVLLALFRLLPLAVSELHRLFAEQGVTDYIEVALQAGRALGSAESPGDLAMLLDYRVSHILVDEMQDTSIAQYRMLEALTSGWESTDGRTLFCVGDPMQSIYRFRNAEVGQFLLAKRHGIGEIRLDSIVLRRNFRSGEFLVHWFNTVFSEVLAPEDDPGRGAVTYVDADPAEHLADRGNCVVHPVFSAAEEADVGCRVIRRILDEHPEGEVAVLVRSRTQLPELLSALRQAGVPYSAVEIDKLTDLPEIIDALALTRAAVHPSDRLAWLGVLRAPWVGLTWSDLHTLVHSDTQRTVFEALEDPKRLERLSDEGREAIDDAIGALRSLIAPAGVTSLRDRIERCWIELGGPGALDNGWAVDNVYRFFDLIERNEIGGALPDVAALESILDDERVSTGNRARLQIMTMHKSKGLQFEHVVLYGLGRKPGGGRPEVLSWLDVPGEDGVDRKILSPVGARSEVERDPLHRYIALSDAAKDRHELGRLLYVACTRARQSLHLVGHVAVARDGQSFRQPIRDSLLYRLWPAVRGHYESAFEPRAEAVDSPDGSDAWIEPVRQCFDRKWSLPPSEPLSRGSSLPVSVRKEEAVEFYWVGTEARIAGTLVHRWLHAIVEGRASSDATADRSGVTARWLKELGISGDSAPGVAERVEEALRGILGDAHGRWLLGGEGHAELALSGIYEGEIVSIAIDRVRIDRDCHWIVDYKTSTHEGGDLDGFLDAEKDRYRPQLERYAKIYSDWAGVPVRCALYFPLLQTFVEVEPGPVRALE